MVERFKHIEGAPVKEIMGHVRDTVNVLNLERKYDCDLIGMSAKWKIINGQYRVEIWENGMWNGVYPMTEQDLEVYE